VGGRRNVRTFCRYGTNSARLAITLISKDGSLGTAFELGHSVSLVPKL
jgi:hypothetical protein